MRPPAALPPLAVLAALTAAAPAAAAPSVSIPDRCYEYRKTVHFAGAGFRAGARYVAVISGRVVARGTVSRFGDLSGSFPAPRPARFGAWERSFTLTIETSREQRASARFVSTVFGADFRPARGDPASLRVRFYAFHFGDGVTVYLHYIRPNRRLRQTILLGRTRGPCGTLVSDVRRLFPFRAEPGNWRLQFDAKRPYDRTPAPPFVRLVVPVLVIR